MPNILLERFTTANRSDEFVSWWTQEHVPSACEVEGLGGEIVSFRALSFEGKYWTYRPEPELTASYVLSPSTAADELVRSGLFKSWAQDAVTRSRAEGGTAQAQCAVQVFGATSALPYQRVLIAAMDVRAEEEGEFNRWYNEDHIPQASEIPGFGSDHRRFRRIDSGIEGFGYAGGQMYVAMYEIQPDADILRAINSDEYRAWSGDFLARWRDLTSNEVSTINERVGH
jgi:hypothetical protein